MTDELGVQLERLSAATDDVVADARGDVTEYRRDGTVFAARNANAVELRLMPDVAEAARRTPDTGASGRGDEWVRFGPSAWDDHARDRLEAWFRVAWRFADQR